MNLNFQTINSRAKLNGSSKNQELVKTSVKTLGTSKFKKSLKLPSSPQRQKNMLLECMFNLNIVTKSSSNDNSKMAYMLNSWMK
jgi:hypothetical protein